jgi:hypothetical protein
MTTKSAGKKAVVTGKRDGVREQSPEHSAKVSIAYEEEEGTENSEL